MEGGKRALRKLIALPDRPTAVLCSNDMTAIGVMREAYDQGISVPQELSVVGFDNIRLSEFMIPPLTTIDMSQTELARIAFKALVSDIGRETPAEHGIEYALSTNLVSGVDRSGRGHQVSCEGFKAIVFDGKKPISNCSVQRSCPGSRAEPQLRRQNIVSCVRRRLFRAANNRAVWIREPFRVRDYRVCSGIRRVRHKRSARRVPLVLIAAKARNRNVSGQRALSVRGVVTEIKSDRVCVELIPVHNHHRPSIIRPAQCICGNQCMPGCRRSDRFLPETRVVLRFRVAPIPG